MGSSTTTPPTEPNGARPRRAAPARRVLFFTTSMGGGGAESHTLRVVNHIDRSRYVPTLAVTARGGSYEPFLHADVEVLGLGLDRLPSSVGRHLAGIPPLMRIIDRLRPDIVCSVMDLPNVAAFAATRLLRRKPRHVFCVQSPPIASYANTVLAPVLGPTLRNVYPRADRIISLTHGVRGDLVEASPRLERNTVVIHNACVDERSDAARNAAPTSDIPATTRPVLVAAGRLVPQKDYPTLLEALVVVRRQVDAELWILGDGVERSRIEDRVRELGLSSAVRMLGFQSAVLDFMKRADAFVLSSAYEGFGNVIVEALAVGTPVVSTNCPHGPDEILTHEENGLLVPVRDPEALGAALARVLTDPALAARLRENGPIRAEAFRAQRIASDYADEFDRVLAE
ncbi:MAG: glycosyltransferase [Polyangiaceae bacterium]